MSLLLELDKKILNDFLKQALEKQVQAYIEGNVKKNIIQTHQKYMKISDEKDQKKNEKDLKKIFKEDSLALQYFRNMIKEDGEAPTNAMGNSSSTQGPIQTFDPLLLKKKVRRKIPAKETIK